MYSHYFSEFRLLDCSVNRFFSVVALIGSVSGFSPYVTERFIGLRVHSLTN